MGLRQNLEAVADAEHKTTVFGELGDGFHDRGEPWDGTAPKVVAIGEPAGNHDCVNPVDSCGTVVDETRIGTEYVVKCPERIMVAVATGKGHDANARTLTHHPSPSPLAISEITRTSYDSITGLARRRSHIRRVASSAVAASGAVTSTNNNLPTRTLPASPNPRAWRPV